MNVRYIKLVILVCLVLGSYCCAQNKEIIHDNNVIGEFISEWSKGDTWEVKTYSNAGERYPPWILSGFVKMTVLETPSADTNDCYVLRYVNTDFKLPTKDSNGVLYYDSKGITSSCLFIFLIEKDLSLKEYRENDKIGGLTGEELEKELTDWKNAKSCGSSPGTIRNNWIRFAFPRRQQESLAIGEANGKPVLTFRADLRFNNRYAVLVWQKGDPWWTSVKFYDSQEKCRYRMELVKTNKELEGKNTEEKFELLYNRWKHAGDANNTIEKEEYYYRIVNLGRDALPFVVEKLKADDEESIKLISELDSYMSYRNSNKNLTKSECLDWWEKNKNKWIIPFPDVNKVKGDANATE